MSAVNVNSLYIKYSKTIKTVIIDTYLTINICRKLDKCNNCNYMLKGTHIFYMVQKKDMDK